MSWCSQDVYEKEKEEEEEVVTDIRTEDVKEVVNGENYDESLPQSNDEDLFDEYDNSDKLGQVTTTTTILLTIFTFANELK